MGLTRKSAIGALLGGGLAALLRPAVSAAADPPGSWNWVQGDERAYVGGLAGDGNGTMSIEAQYDLDIGANHIRMGARDGNYELEHGPDVAETHLNSYYTGTPTRTPISVGDDDGQDLVSFVVRGMKGQRNDLQQWAPSRETTLAVDGLGRLRIGEILLVAEETGHGQRLVAILPGGARRVLAG